MGCCICTIATIGKGSAIVFNDFPFFILAVIADLPVLEIGQFKALACCTYCIRSAILGM